MFTLEWQMPLFVSHLCSSSSSSTLSLAMAMAMAMAFPLPSSLPLPKFPTPDRNSRFPILDNLFLLLSLVPCSNCTFFVSMDTSLRLSSPLSQGNVDLLAYQVVPFHLPMSTLSTLPVAFRIPSALRGSFVVVTTAIASEDDKAPMAQLSLNDQVVVAGDLHVTEDLVVHAISGFLAPFAFAAPFSGGPP